MLIEWLAEGEESLPETEWRKCGPEDYRFYAGDQDSEDVKTLLTNQKRPISVFNEIKPKIDMLVGLAAQTRFQPDVRPVGQEDEPLAELAKAALFFYSRKTKLVRREVECFEHTVKAGRSLLYFYINNENPFKPQLSVKRIPGPNFIVDPQSVEYDMSDARYLFIDKWVSEQDIKALWPHVNVAQIRSHSGEGYPSFWNEQEDLYRVVEGWYRKYVKTRWFINPLTGKQESATVSEYNDFAKLLTSGIPMPDGSQGQPINAPDYQETMVRKTFYMIFSDIFKIVGGPSPYRWKDFPGVLYGAYKNDDTNA